MISINNQISIISTSNHKPMISIRNQIAMILKQSNINDID